MWSGDETLKEQCGRNEGVGVTGDNIVNFGAVVGEIKATISYAQVKFHCVSIHHLRQQDFLDKITQRFNLPTPFSLTYSSLGGPPENLGEAHQSPEIPQNLKGNATTISKLPNQVKRCKYYASMSQVVHCQIVHSLLSLLLQIQTIQPHKLVWINHVKSYPVRMTRLTNTTCQNNMQRLIKSQWQGK